LLVRQIADVEAARETLARPKTAKAPSRIALLERLKGIGPEIASVLYPEGLFRTFGNRRQVAAYAGLAPTPWRSGTVDQEQGISKAGNPRLRSIMIELAWLWQRHQPDSALSRWFHTKVGTERGRICRISIVALARKLLIAIWRYVTQGEIPEGCRLKGGLTRITIQTFQPSRGVIPSGSWWMGRVTTWLRDAPLKNGPILPSTLTSSIRDFGVHLTERRPDVRFCGAVLQLTKGLEPRSELREHCHEPIAR
jgi:hypothetical protein